MDASTGRGLPPSKHFTIAVAVYALYGVLYLGAQHFPLREPTLAPHMELDYKIALSASWVWIYIAAYPFVPLALFYLKEQKYIYGYARSFIILTIGCTLIFGFWPTTLPRAPYPTDDSISGIALEWLRGLDAPTNCLPSLHVASSWHSTWWISKRNRFYGGVAALFTMMVIWSTFALKQHVIWDAITGTLACFLAIWLSYALEAKRSPV